METLKQVVHSVAETVTGHSSSKDSSVPSTMMLSTGCPVAHNKNSLTAGPMGPVLVQDRVLMDKIQHFNREKTPPRNVHALGTGAYGSLTITNPELNKYSCAKVFTMGQKTDLFSRFSGVFTEQGEAETNRDPRGFALKFFTPEGNWDLLAINTPVFNCRDAKIGPDAIHAFKRDPRTGGWNPTQSWDFAASHPESLHQVLMLYTDRCGTPLSYRWMHAFGCNTFSFINEKKERFWVKFHLVSELGWKGLTVRQAKLLAGEDPNWLSRDLHEAIEEGRYPKWRLSFQVMSEEEGYKNPIAFDCTKAWPHAEYPLIEIGVIELNRNPLDHFAEVEQVAFSPANVVPGIGFSPDKLLQGRLLIYDDTQFHRLGPNFKQIPINCPRGIPTGLPNNTYVGGSHQSIVRNNFPHYADSTFGSLTSDSKYLEPAWRCDGPAGFYDYPGEGSDFDYYSQCREFLASIDSKEYPDLIFNLAVSLEKVEPSVVNKVLQHFSQINLDFADLVKKALNDRAQQITPRTEAEMVWSHLNKFLKKDRVDSEQMNKLSDSISKSGDNITMSGDLITPIM